jgi:hypothetical protein
MTLIRFALRRRFALAACLMLAGVFSVPAAANAQLLAFKAPSGNITCMMSTEDGGFAQCELRFKPRRGGFMVPRMGRVSRYDVAGFDDLAEERFVLRYGTSRRLGRFVCSSRQRGMTCRNRVTRHGFTLSRQRQLVF